MRMLLTLSNHYSLFFNQYNFTNRFFQTKSFQVYQQQQFFKSHQIFNQKVKYNVRRRAQLSYSPVPKKF